LRHAHGAGDVNRAGIDDERVFVDRRQQARRAINPQIQGRHVTARGQHTDDEGRALRRVCGRCRQRQALGARLRARRFGQVKSRDLVARFLQVHGHGQTHIAQTDKGDGIISVAHACSCQDSCWVCVWFYRFAVT